MIRWVSAIIFSLLLCPLIQGQNKINGLVVDSLGRPVEYASVVLSSYPAASILAFSQSDSHGNFSFRFTDEQDSIALTARALGYEMAEQRFAARNVPDTIRLMLGNSNLGLREIVIHAEAPPVVVNRDTIEYNAASFSDSTEFSVEDLLKKLPGVQVSENGRISLNGKPVEKVMIEGDDLFGDNYQVATRNVRANMISKVQAINRFQENPMLKGFQESDRLVLNLKIKEEKKRANSGSVMSGSGYGEEWKGYLHLNLFSLSRKDKLYVIGDANNTGENAMADVEWVNRGGIQDAGLESLQKTPLDVQSVIHEPSLQQVGLPVAFTQANKTGLLFVGYVLPVSPRFKVKISSWAGTERLRQKVLIDSRYLLDQDVLTISEIRRQTQKTGVHNIQAETEYFSTNNRHAVRSFLNVNSSPGNYTVPLLRIQGTNDSLQTDNTLDEKTFFAYGALEYTFKASETGLLQILTKHVLYQSTSRLFSDYAYYPLFFGLDSTLKLLHQKSRQQQETGLLSARYLTRQGRFQWSVDAGLNWKWESLDSEFSLQNDQGEKWSSAAGFRNDFHIRSPRMFTGITVSRTGKVLYTRLRLGAGFTRLYPSGDTPVNLWSLEPAFSARYTPNEKSTWSASYRYSQEMPNFSNLYPNYLFSDYQNLESGLPVYALIPEHNASVRYRFGDPVRQYSWNIGSTMHWVSNDFGTGYEINPYLFTQQKFRPIRSSRYSVSGSADRYFPSISSRFEIGLGFTGSLQQNKINDDDLTQTNSQIFTAMFKYGTAFDGWVNGILSHQIAQFNSANTSDGIRTNLQATNLSSALAITIKPPGKFNVKFNFYRVENHAAGRSKTTFWASDGICSLFLPAWRSQFQLSGFNLFNTSRFDQVLADGFLQSTTSITAIHPFFLVTWDYGF